MYLLWRSWSAFIALLATVLTILAILSVLQHNAVLSDLIRQRLSVVVQSVESSFSTVVDLGLPLSMMRNADDVLLRAKTLDPDIEAIHVYNYSGIAVHTTEELLPPPLSNEELTQLNLSKTGKWSNETDTNFYSYISIVNPNGTAVGGVVAVYPKKGFETTVANITTDVALATVSLLLLFSLIGFIVIRLRLFQAIKGAEMLKRWLANRKQNPNSYQIPETLEQDETHPKFIELLNYLNTADRNYNQLDEQLKKWENTYSQNQVSPIKCAPQIVMSPLFDIALGKIYEAKLYPWIIGMILAATLSLGFITYSSINNSFEPEMAKRTDLIAHIATENIQRGVSAGIPLENMVGLEGYFNNVLANFPEISFFGVATGKFVFKAGDWQNSLSHSYKGAKQVPFYPIITGEEEIGYIIIRPE